MVNFGATIEPGEPRFNGRMNKTIWGRLTSDRNRRVVIHTFGSDFDTALAVHTGTQVNRLRKVVFNDNYRVAGLSNTESLVQFDAKKNTRYKFGSKRGDEGDIFANVFVFPPSGGLSALLAKIDGAAHNGRDYNCVIGDSLGNACGNPTFLLHNSTDGTVRITASSDLGRGVTPPPPLTLAPGKAALATFRFGASFDKATIRTIAGHFTFVANRGGRVISRAIVRALIVVKSQRVSPDALQATNVAPTVQSNWMNFTNEFTVTLKNTGTVTAKHCHARAERFEYVRAIWQRLRSGRPVGRPIRRSIFRRASPRHSASLPAAWNTRLPTRPSRAPRTS